MRLLGGHVVPDEQDLHRFAPGNLTRQTSQGTARGHDGSRDLGETEASVLGSDTNVAGLDELRASGQAKAVDRSYYRLVDGAATHEGYVSDLAVL